MGRTCHRRIARRTVHLEPASLRRMILTVTANAAVDKTLTVANLQLGRRHRAQQGQVMPGGKGINVARALKRLGEPVIAVGLAGGRAGTQITDGPTPRASSTTSSASTPTHAPRPPWSTPPAAFRPRSTSTGRR